MKRAIIFAAAACFMLSASAAESSFTFNTANAPADYYGMGKKENYDIAVCLNNPVLTGTKVTGLRVQIPGETELYGAPSAFMTTELKVDRVDGVRVNVPDICSVEATIADGWLTATFEEPYTLTEEPVFVGYSFEVETLEEASKKPVAIVTGDNPDGFWFHSSRTALKWANYVHKEAVGIQSAMIILLEGDFSAFCAAPSLPERQIYALGEESVYGFEVVNGGSSAISSVECKWTLNDQEGDFTYNFHTPINNAIGAEGKAYFTLPSIETAGKYPLTVTITKVNGGDNTGRNTTGEGTVIFSPVKPVKLPLVEEYTGMWCGWCTGGYVALEWMKEMNGYDFVAAAWHNDDPLCVTRSSYPNQVGGFPASYFNRSVDVYPVDIPSVWGNYCQGDVDYAITCTTELSDDNKTLKATSHITSIEDQDATPVIGYLLVADGLHSPDWEQHNYYPTNVGNSEMIQKATGFPKEWADFLASSDNLVDIVFNDVVVNFDYSAGLKGSIPENIVAFETYDHEVTFDLSAIVAYSGSPIEVIPEKVRVIAYLLNSDRTVINACSSAYPGEPAPIVAVDSVGADEVISTAWFDLQGRRVNEPANGIYLRLDTMSDGTVRASKRILR